MELCFVVQKKKQQQNIEEYNSFGVLVFVYIFLFLVVTDYGD